MNSTKIKNAADAAISNLIKLVDELEGERDDLKTKLALADGKILNLQGELEDAINEIREADERRES